MIYACCSISVIIKVISDSKSDAARDKEAAIPFNMKWAWMSI